MYKLYSDLKNGSNHVFYQNSQVPHLWLLASNGAYKIAKGEFCENLITIASKFNDELFINDIAILITQINSIDSDYIEISGPHVGANFAALQQHVDMFDYESIFGEVVNTTEFYQTAATEDYFKAYQKKYRNQYLSITKILIIINVVVFIANMIFGYSPIQFIFGAYPISLYAAIPILFAGFTHFSFFHIFFNMTFLQSIGPMLEQIMGRTKFIALYFIGLFVSGIFVIVFTNGMAATAGASGALYALFGYFICYVLKYGTDRNHRNSVLGSFAFNIILTFMYPGISVAGHIGGAIAGAIFFWLEHLFKK